MWVILDFNGNVLSNFVTPNEAYEATYTGDFPDDCEVAYLN